MAATITTVEKYFRGTTEYGTIKVSIPTADVLQLNGTPIDVIAAPGSGKTIQCLSGYLDIPTYGGTPYATNVSISAQISGADLPQLWNQYFLNTSVAKGFFWTPYNGFPITATLTQMIPNTKLQIICGGGNPTAGNSNIVCYITYKIFVL